MKYNTICKLPAMTRKDIMHIVNNPRPGSNGLYYDTAFISGILFGLQDAGIIAPVEQMKLYDYYTAWYFHARERRDMCV